MHKCCLLLLVCLLFVLAGCAGSGGLMPLTDASIATVTGGVTSSVGYVTDVSAIKELSVHKTLQNRDEMIRDAHKDAGMRLDWQSIEETVYYPGMTEPITVTRYLPTITYNEQAQFSQQLPTVPSTHPGWRTMEKIGVAAINGTVIGMGIKASADVLETAINSAGGNTTYQGDVSAGNSVDKSTGPVDASTGPIDNSTYAADNSIRVDNSDNSDNSATDNSDNSDRSVDNLIPPIADEK